MVSLYEVTRSELEGIPQGSDHDALVSMVDRHEGDPGVFVSYQDPEHMVLGLNTRASYSTPLGIYGYPVSDVNVRQNILDNTLPYAGGRPWIYFFRFKDMSKVWNLSMDNPQNTVEKLKRIFPEGDVDEFVYNKSTEIGSESVDSRVVFFTTHEMAGRGKLVVWSKLLLKLGYHGVVDYGQGIIYDGEPIQGFALSSKFIEVVGQLRNPFPTDSGEDSERFSNTLDRIREKRGLPKAQEVILQFLRSPKQSLTVKQKCLSYVSSSFITWDLLWKILEIDPGLEPPWRSLALNLSSKFAQRPEEAIDEVVEVVKRLKPFPELLEYAYRIVLDEFLYLEYENTHVRILKQLYSHETTIDLAERAMDGLRRLSTPAEYDHLAKRLEDLGLRSGEE